MASGNWKGVSKKKPSYTTYSCQLCNEIDIPEMVQCDSCDLWFHFDCVNVSSDVAHMNWYCQKCLTESHDRSKAQHDSATSTASKSCSKLSNVSTKVKQSAAALQKLEEEQAIRLDILNRKYQIMDRINEEEDFGRQSSLDYTLHWAKKVN